jgi:hypothetical protein
MLESRMNRSAQKAKQGGTKESAKMAGGRRNVPRIVRVAERLGRSIPKEELQRIPKDLSSQIDHYVYGTPKR